MKFRHILPAMLLMASCQGHQKQINSPEQVDTITTQSLQPNEKNGPETADDLSMLAYGGAKFGMSPDEVLQTDGFSGGTKSGENVRPPSSKRRVGNYDYDIVASFHENKLYLVSFSSAWQTAAFIEFDMLTVLNNLKDVITIRYGEPTHKYKMPNVMDFEPGVRRWVYLWEIEDKVISVGMRESNEGANYQAIMWIYNKPIFDRIGYNKANVNKVRDAAKF